MRSNTIVITKTAVFTALIFIATQFIRLPLPVGYVNMGDGLVVLAGWSIGGFYGCIAAAVGSALADLLSGYAMYIPVSIVIKSVMAFVAYKGLTVSRKFSRKIPGMILLASATIAEMFMVSGYFLYEAVIYGNGGAVISVPGNVGQGIVAILVSFFVWRYIGKK